MLLITGLYLVALILAIYFTRAVVRRVVGALAGGAIGSLIGLKAIALCEALGWWSVPFPSAKYFVAVFYVGLAITLAPIYLITWRLTRRYGWQGLAVFAAIVAIIGPPRDYLYALTFPKWMVFSPGIAPMLADSATYVGVVLVGHAVMRLVAGPAHADRLARTSAR